jgi:ribosomal protein L11 methylase PrmA
VLGLCALGLGAARVVAVDLKPGAVEATRSNVTLNWMDRRLDATDAPLGGSSSNERPTRRTPRTYERAL